MEKRNKILYWVSTCWLALGMVSTGIVQLMQIKPEVDFILSLGYPGYFLTIIGAWKLLGVIVVLLPGLPLLKEWAYAGFFFLMSGAVLSHIALGNEIKEIWPSSLLLVLTAISWYFRPENRKILITNKKSA